METADSPDSFLSFFSLSLAFLFEAFEKGNSNNR